MPSSSSPLDATLAPRPAPRRRPRPAASRGGAKEEDGWVDIVADEVGDLLAEEGLDLELLVFYDPLTETLHAVGYDGAPARYFRTLEGNVPRAHRAEDPASTQDRQEEGGPSGSSGCDRAILPMTAMAGTDLAMRAKENPS
jgi:hypothetical protein